MRLEGATHAGGLVLAAPFCCAIRALQGKPRPQGAHSSPAARLVQAPPLSLARSLAVSWATGPSLSINCPGSSILHESTADRPVQPDIGSAIRTAMAQASRIAIANCALGHACVCVCRVLHTAKHTGRRRQERRGGPRSCVSLRHTHARAQEQEPSPSVDRDPSQVQPILPIIRLEEALAHSGLRSFSLCGDRWSH